jgi:hypothetical protein
MQDKPPPAGQPPANLCPANITTQENDLCAMQYRFVALKIFLSVHYERDAENN